MTHYNILNVKSSNLQLSKLKPRIKNGMEVTLNLLPNVAGDSNNETNFPHKLLSTDTQVSRLHKAVANGSSANIKLSKTYLSGGLSKLSKLTIRRNSSTLMEKIMGPALKVAVLGAGVVTSLDGAKSDKEVPNLLLDVRHEFLAREILLSYTGITLANK